MSRKLTIPQPKTLCIRQATEHDRSAILALMRQRDYNRMKLDPSRFFVATIPHGAANDPVMTVVGIGQIKRHWDGTAELASLVVAEHLRRQGIGSALVRALIAHHFHADRSSGSKAGDIQSGASAVANERALHQYSEQNYSVENYSVENYSVENYSGENYSVENYSGENQPPQPLYLFSLSTLESYYQQFGFRQAVKHSLPWPLYLMHRIGNGVGRFAHYWSGAGFSVIAMRLDARMATQDRRQNKWPCASPTVLPFGGQKLVAHLCKV